MAEQHGVLFLPQGEMLVTGDYWRVVIEINVTKIQMNISQLQESVRDARIALAGAVATAPKLTLLSTVVEESEEIIEDMERTCRVIEEMLPHSRPRRGLLNIGGKAIKVLFGNPDAEDLEAIHGELEKLNSQASEATHVQRKLLTVTRTLTRKTEENNERIRNLASVVAKLVGPMLLRQQAIETELQETDFTLQMFINASVLIHNLRIASIRGLAELRTMVESLQAVSAGEGISPNLLSPLEFSNIVKSLRLSLPRELSLITGTDITDMYRYYSLTTVFAHSVDHVIRVVVDVPLASQDHLFRVYLTKAIPVIQPSTGVLVRFRLPEEVFIISEDQELHSTFPLTNLEDCKGNDPVICPANFILRYRLEKTCQSVLFLGEGEDVIMELCERVILSGIPPPTWIWDKMSGEWYYSLPKPEELHADCRTDAATKVTTQIVQGLGRLNPEETCTYRTNHYLILRRSRGSSRLLRDHQIVKIPDVIPINTKEPPALATRDEAWELIGELTAEGRTHSGPHGDEILAEDFVRTLVTRREKTNFRNWAMCITMGLLTIGVILAIMWFYCQRRKKAFHAREGTAEDDEATSTQGTFRVAHPVFRLATLQREGRPDAYASVN